MNKEISLSPEQEEEIFRKVLKQIVEKTLSRSSCDDEYISIVEKQNCIRRKLLKRIPFKCKLLFKCYEHQSLERRRYLMPLLLAMYEAGYNPDENEDKNT